MEIKRVIRYATRVAVVGTLISLNVQGASAQNYSIHHDGGGETFIDTAISPQIFTAYVAAETSGEKLAAVIDYVDAASSARRMFSASAGGLFLGNYKE